MEEIGEKKRKKKKKNSSKSGSVGLVPMSVVMKLHCWFLRDHSEGEEDSESGLGESKTVFSVFCKRGVVADADLNFGIF